MSDAWRAARDASRCKITLGKKHPGRRDEYLNDIPKALRGYFPDVFYQPFNEQRLKMVEGIVRAVSFGGDQAIAAERGGGKTRVAMGTALMLLLRGSAEVLPIVSKNQGEANRALEATVKTWLETKDLLLEDFPEVCIPVRRVGAWASVANRLEVGGEPIFMEWSGSQVVFPVVHRPWSLAKQQGIACRGWEGQLRGLTILNKRPSVVIIDDIDDRESASSQVQTEAREEVIEKDIAGMAGPDKTVSRIMLCTVVSAGCVAATYTDRSKRPSWNGMRMRRMVQWPDRVDLWDQYISLLQTRDFDLDPHGRVAHTFYLENRDAMDAGAEVSNLDRYDKRITADGSELESSAIESCFAFIANGGPHGREAFDTEFQNIPPEVEERDDDDRLTSAKVSANLNGFERAVCADDTQVITAAIDVGKRELHWVVMASLPNGHGMVMDYGRWIVSGANVHGTEKAVLAALQELRDDLLAREYVTVSGRRRGIQRAYVDAGTWTETVYQFVAESAPVFRASMGLAVYRPVADSSRIRRPGYEAWHSRQRKNVWVLNINTNYWKQRVDDGFAVAVMDQGGSLSRAALSLYGNEPREHTDADTGNFAQQIVNEWFVAPSADGTKKKTGWIRRGANHFKDCVAMALCAAGQMGVRPTRTATIATPEPPPVYTPPVAKPAFATQKPTSQIEPPRVISSKSYMPQRRGGFATSHKGTY